MTKPQKDTKTVAVPADLIDETLTFVVEHPAKSCYVTLRKWERLRPQFFRETSVPRS